MVNPLLAVSGATFLIMSSVLFVAGTINTRTVWRAILIVIEMPRPIRYGLGFVLSLLGFTFIYGSVKF